MGSNSGGGKDEEKKKRKIDTENMTQPEDRDKYKNYLKPNYQRLFADNCNFTEYTVYVESTIKETIGNRNPIYLTKLFSENAKGIFRMQRVTAYKIAVTFKQPALANNFLQMTKFLNSYNLKAYVPAHLVEKIGVIKFVPKDISNEELFKQISCDYEVVAIRRFMKKDTDGKLIPLNTISVTFLSSTLPTHVYISMWRYTIHTYIPPLRQCYKCFQFNHSAKVCRNEQKCSLCSGPHFYKECNVKEIKCCNCGGEHLAISRDCPIKIKKIEERKNKNTYSQSLQVDNNNFPPLPTKPSPSQLQPLVSKNSKQQLHTIADNDIIINAIIKSILSFANGNDPVTRKKIKEVFLANLI